jgi:hypothetical protein
MTEEELQEHFDLFYEDFFIELAKYGEIEELTVCDNVGDHLVGNVYAMYRHEEDAEKAVESLNQRFYAGERIFHFVARAFGLFAWACADHPIFFGSRSSSLCGAFPGHGL